ncbi:Hypothetical predicted protein [Paramuricea clavata]|uniref:Uncharacterized protein n=1 Tax=Paramuricea clavata TaxID=317549 RepID=A0A6S7H448_PARCT|nr:Hypothetical predicted protein [Paramuricea clavata]
MADVDAPSIRPEELEDLVKGLEHYLSKIKKGEGPQERAAAFGHGGTKGCKDLDYKFKCPMSHFTDTQHELVAKTLVNMFGVENDTEANYIMKDISLRKYLSSQTPEKKTKERASPPPSLLPMFDDSNDSYVIPLTETSKRMKRKRPTTFTVEETDESTSDGEDKEPKKRERRVRECPFCKKGYKYLTSHLRTLHGKTKKESIQISSRHRAVKEGVDQKRKPLLCPVPGCDKMVARIDLHLRRIHHINKEDPEYRRYNDEIALARAKAKFEDNAAAAKKPRKTKKKSTETQPDPSIHGEDLPPPSSSGSESESQDTPLAILLSKPRRPKAEPDPSMMREIEELPVFQLFQHHLNFESGSRKAAVAKDHTRRVCRLLYEIEDPPKNVHQLWDNCKINILSKNFFRGNDLLSKKDKRQPLTLKAYTISLQLFLRFVIVRQEDIRLIATLTNDDIRLVNIAIMRLETWPKAFTDTANFRKAEIRKRDVEERLNLRSGL